MNRDGTAVLDRDARASPQSHQVEGTGTKRTPTNIQTAVKPGTKTITSQGPTFFCGTGLATDR